MPIATTLPGHSGLAIVEDLLIVEVVDEHDRPVPPGTPGHRVLLTNLVNRVQPLIRYEISDSVTPAGNGDFTRLPYRRILRVDGRSDALRLPAAAEARSRSTRITCTRRLPASRSSPVPVHPCKRRRFASARCSRLQLRPRAGAASATRLSGRSRPPVRQLRR